MIKFFIFLYSLQLFAHQTGLSYIELIENDTKEISVIYKKPLEDIGATPIFIRYPKSCKKTSNSIVVVEDGYIIEKYRIRCGDNGLLNSRIWIDGMLRSDKGVAISYINASIKQTALLRKTTPFIFITRHNSRYDYFKEYLNLGLFHILSGYDHLFFVLAVFLLAKKIKGLLLSVTAFTFAHSITLVSAMFGLINIPIVFVEAMIALSVVYLARELFLNHDTFTKNNLEYIAFIFGLLHGFGFSSALSSIGLPQDSVVLSLFAFNIGIEIGQLLFILLLSVCFYLLQKYVNNYISLIKKIISYFIGSISSYWLIERILSF
jgi:hydrogenase/urease accessory protein HupE